MIVECSSSLLLYALANRERKKKFCSATALKESDCSILYLCSFWGKKNFIVLTHVPIHMRHFYHQELLIPAKDLYCINNVVIKFTCKQVSFVLLS